MTMYDARSIESNPTPQKHGSAGRVWVGLGVVAILVTLAVIVGNRLSDEALAVLAGAVCGVGAAIPTSLLIVAVSRRRNDRDESPRPMPGGYPLNGYPPVVVVAPPYAGPAQFPTAATWEDAPGPRHFTVVGDE
jgi:hypothetical protein